MKNRKAFTLIELLAVIVILGVIALISTPIVLNVIENAEKQSNKNSAYGLIDSGRLYYSESLLNEEKANNVEQLLNIWDDVVVTGNKPKHGELFVSSNGNIALSVIYGDICYQKTFTGELELKEKDNCSLGYVGPDSTSPTVTFEPLNNPFNENNWAKEDFYVKVNIIDTESGADSYLWCSTTGNNCEPKSQVKGSNGTVSIDTEGSSNRICVIGLDKNGNSSDTICSDPYKLDKTAPVINGLTDITINLKDVLDLSNGVIVNDALSGSDENYEFNPKDVERSQTGIHEITYTALDLAGNIGESKRKVTTKADKPNVEFTTAEGTFNENGWSNQNFYAHITGIDYSGHGIKELKWCSTTSTICDPNLGGIITSITGDIEITTETSENRVCVIAVDNDGNSSEAICSNNYQLDKTNPSLTGIGDITASKDQTVDLTIGVVQNDSLSGLGGTFTYNPTSVDTSKSGITNITYTVKDLAGNTQTYIRKVIVTAGAPTVIFTVEPGKINGSGWAKEQFLVTFTPIDHSGHGINNFKWCSTTSASCDPNGNGAQTTPTGAATISTESASNRICVIATDNAGTSSTNICSDTYKLDKTAPVAGTFNASGTAGNNGWYRSDVNLTANNGSDAASGHASTTIDRSNVSGNTVGTIVTITTTDIAGNTATRTQTVKIDKGVPSITINPTSVTITQGDNYNLNTGISITDVGESGIGSQSIKYGGNVIGSTTGLATGTHTITYEATDVAGNTTSRNRTIVVNKKPDVAKNYILAGDPLVSGTTTGLQQGTNHFGVTEYVYKSDSISSQPKNYINIGGVIFRIISIANDGTLKVITKDIIGSLRYDKPEARYNSNNTYCQGGGSPVQENGCNVWSATSGNYVVSYNGNSNYASGTVTQDSAFKTYLNETYYIGLNSVIKNLMITGPWYFGAYDHNIPLDFNQLYNYRTDSNVGLINAEEFYKASSIDSCNPWSNNKPKCVSWIGRDNVGSTGTITATAIRRTIPVYMAETDLNTTVSSFSVFARPVIYIRANATITSGTGTETDPYIAS